MLNLIAPCVSPCFKIYIYVFKICKKLISITNNGLEHSHIAKMGEIAQILTLNVKNDYDKSIFR